MKANGEIVKFLKQKDYLMVNNNLGSGSFGQTVLLQDPFIDELFVAKKYEPSLLHPTKSNCSSQSMQKYLNVLYLAMCSWDLYNIS